MLEALGCTFPDLQGMRQPCAREDSVRDTAPPASSWRVRPHICFPTVSITLPNIPSFRGR